MSDKKAFDTAVEWWVRLDRHPGEGPVRTEFERWRAADPAHAVAFEEVCALWGELQGMTPQMVTRQQPRSTGELPRRYRRRGLAGLTMAASLLLLWLSPALQPGKHYRAPAGQTLQVVLEDDSIVQLDGGSAMTVDFESDRRRVTLLQGEAWFKVAPEPQRPFMVRAGAGTVTALGTEFDLRLHELGLEATAIAHRIRVRADKASPEGNTLEPGEQISVDRSGTPTIPRRTNPRDVTAWRSGRLVFQDQTLAEVVETLNRHYRGHFFIAGAELRLRRVSGVFYAQKPLEALAGIETALGLHSTHVRDYLIVLHR